MLVAHVLIQLLDLVLREVEELQVLQVKQILYDLAIDPSVYKQKVSLNN